jgi:hypothetical protein
MSRKVYTMVVTGLVSYYVGQSFEIEAPNLEEARKKAEAEFEEWVGNKTVYCKLTDVRADYMEVAEYD